MRKFKIDKKHFNFLLKAIILIASYSYIAYKIYLTKNIKDFIYHGFQANTSKQINLLLFVVILMLINWSLEAYKWKLLIARIEYIDFFKSLKSVLTGISAGIFTLNRIGEFIGRPITLLKVNRSKGIMAFFVGSLAQNIVTISIGLISLNLYLTQNSKLFPIEITQFILLFSFIILTGFIIIYYNPRFLKIIEKIKIFKLKKDKFDFLIHYRKVELFKILIISILRYIVFTGQFYILLKIFQVNIGYWESIMIISIIYLLLLIIPSFSISELGIRISLSISLFAPFSNNDFQIIAATSFLWFINLAIPATIGGIFLIRQKI